ncbi:MAG: HTH-type transcriptional repressor ComR [Nocardia sp.]|uniref:TetR/AcrR family transcriptional regulator n=1 Tax=Nocardia sp. TaxID=1821 RepID=UPI0026068837|nr:TetR/AcrR family transcriptional regulator [Nocardia sp.]MCU1645880.1 HTH-type transcriptional repressor ComR [Nocardia sp.]
MGRPRDFETDTVLERAMEAFWTHGYANTSPALLAEATGIGKGSLYNAFGSKRELFDQVLSYYDRAGTELATGVLAEPGTTRERLRAWMRFAVDTDLAQPVRRGCLVANTALELAGHDAEANRAVTVAQQHMVETLAARIDRGRRDGDVPAEIDPQAYAEFIVNTIAGLRVIAKTADSATLHRIIDTALTTL